jgi:PAS domain S-box-containing protein
MTIELSALAAEASQLVRQHLWLVGLIALFSVGVTLIGIQLFVLKSANVLIRVTNRIAAGDFSARTQLVAGIPGVSRLSEAVNTMATALEARHQQLQASEERFRRIAETISEVFWIADVDIKTIVYVSPAYERIWGRSRESLYQNPRSFLMAIHPEDFQRVVNGLEVQRAGQPFDHEYRIIRPDGTIRWIWDRGFPVPNSSGPVIQYIGIAQDITDRVHLKRAYRDMEERMRFALEAAHVGVWESDLTTGVSFWSATCEVMHGLAPGTFGKTFDAFLDRMDPDDRPRVRQQIQHAIREHREAEIEYLTTWPDGSRHWIVATAHFFYDERGGPVRGAGVTVDVTERHSLEEQLRHARELSVPRQPKLDN